MKIMFLILLVWLVDSLIMIAFSDELNFHFNTKDYYFIMWTCVFLTPVVFLGGVYTIYYFNTYKERHPYTHHAIDWNFGG